MFQFKAITIGGVLVAAAAGSSALTLGALQGAAWIGQRLDVAVVVQLEPGRSVSPLCAQADVFHADSKVDPSRVQALVEPTERADTFTVRVISSALVDEPVVAIQLRVGCEQEVSRRYVLLADLPSETIAQVARPRADFGTSSPVAPATTLVDASPPPSIASSSGPSAAVGEGRPAASAKGRAAPGKPSGPAVSKKQAPGKSADSKDANKDANKARATTAAAAPASTPSTGRARLTLDPLETLVERVKTLESTTSATPLEDLVHASQRIEQLQTDMKTLLAQSAKNDASLLVLQGRLKDAEQNRFAEGVIYLLAGLVLLCLGGMALLWRRIAVLMGSLEEERRVSFAEAMHPHSVPESEVRLTPPDTVVRGITPVDVDVDLLDLDERGFNDIMKPKATESAGLSVVQEAVFENTELTAGHPDFNTESQHTLIDQAGLFVQLGKIDQATDILEKRIRQNAADCPLVFLEVLRVTNENSLKTDFRQFREEFQQVFNVVVPDFALFRAEGRSLDAYPGLLQHIAKLWPTAKVLEVIESCLLHSAWGNNSEPFDMAAFRELVLLHGIARSVVRPADASVTHERVAMDEESQHVDLDL